MNKRSNQNFEIRKTNNMISKENMGNKFMRGSFKVSKLIQKWILFIYRQAYLWKTFKFNFTINNYLFAQIDWKIIRQSTLTILLLFLIQCYRNTLALFVIFEMTIFENINRQYEEANIWVLRSPVAAKSRNFQYCT